MAVTIDRDSLIRFTQELVRTRSVHVPSDGLTEAPAAALVAEKMRSFGWTPLIEEAAPGRPNVVATVDGGLPGPTLLFEGHTDVVTPGDASAWHRDPFGGEIEGGRLHGRGAADMKGGVAAMIHAAAAVAAAGPFPGRIIVAALADEEGLMLGVKHFVAAGHAEEVDAAIVCEPEGGEVCTAQKGAIRARFDATGRMAHGAMPDHGLNPIPILARLAVEIAEFERTLQDKVGPHPLLGLPFLTPTVLEAGSMPQLNVIPGTATLALDVRTVPGVAHEALIDTLRMLATDVAGASGVEVALTIIDDRPPTEIAPDHPVARALIEAHEEVTGATPSIGGVPGTTDGTILWRDAKLPVVVYGPGGKWIAHQADEYVEVAELEQAAQVYASAALRFLNAGR